MPLNRVETNSESDSGDDNPPDDRQIPLDLQRLNNVEWCTCGCCRADDLETVQECVFCRELAKVQALNGNHGGPASHSTLDLRQSASMNMCWTWPIHTTSRTMATSTNPHTSII
ncbi:hypothetical protein KUCAC02_017896 [Chaenocephalus aceratus]|nr:hypothetical protein KUCAC02_017896 [Chaenocephalus aceratus]